MSIHKEQNVTWQTWLQTCRMGVQQGAQRAPLYPHLKVRKPWLRRRDGTIERKDLAFFRVIGLIVHAVREVTYWWQPILEDRGEGIVVLIVCDDQYLVQAKFEPGNPGGEFDEVRDPRNGVLVAPTIQASWSNYTQAHQGRPPLLHDLVATIPEHKWLRIHKDGNRFLGKVNRHAVLRVQPGHPMTEHPPAGMHWVSRAELCEIIHSGECNEHLVQTAGCLWAAQFDEGGQE